MVAVLLPREYFYLVLGAVLVGCIVYGIYCSFYNGCFICGNEHTYEIHDPTEIETFEANYSKFRGVAENTDFVTTLNQKNQPIKSWLSSICCAGMFINRYNDWVVCPQTATVRHRRWYKCIAYGDRMRNILLDLLQNINVSSEKPQEKKD